MTESQRLAAQAYRKLAEQGWPEVSALELGELFMQAGFYHCMEMQEALRKQDAELIKRATSGVMQ